METVSSHLPVWLLAHSLLVWCGILYLLWRLHDEPPHPQIAQASCRPGATALGADTTVTCEGTDAAWPFVSIIVPVRNEEQALPTLLKSLVNQTYLRHRYEIIVVDDQSTDRSALIAGAFAKQYHRIRHLSGSAPPSGWTGKCWAMQQGATHSRGEWLLFTDADTHHEPAGLRTTIHDALQQRVDLYTLLPKFVFVGPSERLILPLILLPLFTFFHHSSVNSPRSSLAFANGQYLLIRRPVLEALGGIASVRDEFVEDLELGRLVKGRGSKVCVVDAAEFVQVRMYRSFRDIWAGCRRNALASFRKQPLLGLLMLLTLAGIGVTPFVLFGYYLVQIAQQGAAVRPDQLWGGILAGLQIAVLLVGKRQLDRKFGLPRRWAVTLPLGLIIVAAILFDGSLRLVSGRGVTWKGRVY